MKHPVRRLAGLPALLLGSALLLAPGAALADRDDHRRRGEHRHGLESFHESRGLELHGSWRFSPRVARHRHHARTASYYCERCHHGFHRRRAFHRHLHRDHGVPFARLPFVIVHTSFGWVFGG